MSSYHCHVKPVFPPLRIVATASCRRKAGNDVIFAEKTMMHKEEKHCVYCSSADLLKNGKCPGGSQYGAVTVEKRDFGLITATMPANRGFVKK